MGMLLCELFSGTFGVEMRAFGQKLVKFCTLAHAAKLVVEICKLCCTVVPVMNGHPRDQAKVSVHCRWPLVTGMDGVAGDAKYNSPCNTT